MRLSKIASVALMAGTVVFGFFRLRYGFSFSDEGLFLSTPLRYCLGDVPFRDEVLDSLKGFHIMMSPLLCRLPVVGTVILFREIAFTFHFLCVGALLFSLRKFLNPMMLAMLFVIGTLSNIFNYWTPSYHTLAFDFICAAAFFLVMGTGARSPGKSILPGVAAGVAISLAWVCEIPMLPLIAVPVLIAFTAHAHIHKGMRAARGLDTRRKIAVGAQYGDERDDSFWRVASACCISMFMVSVVVLLCVIRAVQTSGLFPDIAFSLEMLSTVKQYGGGAWERVAGFFRDLRIPMQWAFFNAVCWLLIFGLMRRWSSGGKKLIYMICALSIILIYVLFPFILFIKRNDIYFISDWFEGLCVVCLVIAPAAMSSRKISWKSREKIVCLLLFSVGALLFLILGVATAGGLLVGAVLGLPFLLLSAVLCISHSFSGIKAPDTGRKTSALLCGCVCASLFVCNLFSFYDEVWVWRYDAWYETDRLRGIAHKASLVHDTDALVKYLRPRIGKGEALLAFYDITMLHFLTETRSALSTGCPNMNWPDETRERFVEIMIQRRRTPQYAVLYGPAGDEPLFNFVRKNYRLDARIGSYFVWKLRERRQ